MSRRGISENTATSVAPEGTFRANASRRTASLSLLSFVNSYLRYYAAGATHTARAKRLDLQHFIDFLQKHCGYSKQEKLKLADFSVESVKRFMEERSTRGEAAATISRRLATIKHFGRVISEQLSGYNNPARQVRAPRPASARPRALTANELRKARALAKRRITEKNSFIRLRNQTLFDLLLETGLRPDEVRLLKMSQIPKELEWIKDVRAKGNRYRNVYITSRLREGLQAYLDARKTELMRRLPDLSPKADRTLPVFISLYAADPLQPDSFLMGAKSIWRAVNEICSEMNLHPHLLRHSFALDLLRTSKDLGLVAKALGHSDLRVTMKYTDCGADEIAKALEARGEKGYSKG